METVTKATWLKEWLWQYDFQLVSIGNRKRIYIQRYSDRTIALLWIIQILQIYTRINSTAKSLGLKFLVLASNCQKWKISHPLPNRKYLCDEFSQSIPPHMFIWKSKHTSYGYEWHL